MMQTFIVGNLTRDPEKKATKDGSSVCNFTVAVSKIGVGGAKSAVYFEVSAWAKIGDACALYLKKGQKVVVSGEVSAHAFTGREGVPKAVLRLTAKNVEFFTEKPKQQETSVEPYMTAETYAKQDKLDFGFGKPESADIPF